MPYTVPSASDFKTRFPVFSSESNDRVSLFINEASRRVDTTWREEDYQTAILYFAAHLLASENAQSGGGSGVVQSESFGGEISKTYKVDDDAMGLGGTVYGRRFRELEQLNHPGPLVIGQ